MDRHERKEQAQKLLKEYGARNTPEMREAAEIAIARSQEAVESGTDKRRYY